MPAKLTEQEFLKRLKEKQNGTIIKLDPYTASDVKHKVKCLVCNHVWKANGYTLTCSKPNGCPKCAQDKKSYKLKLSEKEVIKRLEKLHNGTIKLISGYSKVGDKALFKCKCGHKWEARCFSLVKPKPHGCPECSKWKAAELRRYTHQQIVNIINSIHEDRIKVIGKYTYIKDNIKVKCCICGKIFYASPDNLTKGHGCSSCARSGSSNPNFKSEKEYKRQLLKIHKGNIILVSKYTKQTSRLKFKCSKGHTWWTSYAYGLISKNPTGCPRCSNRVSKGELELFNWVKKLCPDAKQSVKKIRDSSTGALVEWDIYIPSKNLAIEYNGVYFHSYPKKDKDYHYRKTQASKQKGVHLIHITDVDWNTKKNVVKKTLRHALGVTTERFYARDLKVDSKENLSQACRRFYSNNHLQGSPRSGITYALLLDNKIKALMTFCKIQSERGIKHSGDDYELIRYASRGSVVGGASRLLKHFIKDYKPSKIISFSQNDYFEGNLYKILGFKLVKELTPDYRTVWDGELRHKTFTKRSNLGRLLGDNFYPELSEAENLIQAQIPILYDSGKLKWELLLR